MIACRDARGSQSDALSALCSLKPFSPFSHLPITVNGRKGARSAAQKACHSISSPSRVLLEDPVRMIL